MRKILLLPLLLLMVFMASAQSNEQISYYYKGKKVYFPVSYDRLVVGIKQGHTFNELRNVVPSLAAVPVDSVQETLTGKQVLIKLGKNNTRNMTAVIAQLKQNPAVTFARPVFLSASGKYNSYGDEFIVNLKSTTSFADMISLTLATGSRLVRKYPFQEDMYIIAAGADYGYDGLAVANLFYETGKYDYAEPNKYVYDALHVDPNDPLFSLQWAHKNTGSAAQFSGTPGADMKVQDAWDITMGSASIKIGVIDEGVDLTHPDLQANLLQGFHGGSMSSGPGDGAPTYAGGAHGTNCAGIIAGIANNGIGVAGVAPNCKIIPAVIFGGTSGSYLGDAAVAASFDYVRTNGADVISNSWGGGAPSSTIDAAIDRAVTLGRGGKGCVVLFSSGNDNSIVAYPATHPQVISVGGVNMCNQRKSPTSCDGETWWGANFGTGLDIVAPCVKIASTDIQGTGGYNTAAGTAGDYYNIFNGTSSSCPNAAGVAALILSVNDELLLVEARAILELSCDKVPGFTFGTTPGQPNGTWNNEMGHGRVNAFTAVQQALLTVCPKPTINAPTVTQPVCPVSTGTIVVNASGSGTIEYSLDNGAFQLSNTFNGVAPGGHTIRARYAGGDPTCIRLYSGNPVFIIPPNTAVTTISYTGPAVAIPDGNANGVNIPIVVSGSGTITDLNFRFDAAPTGTCDAVALNTNAAVDHTWLGDLVFKLTSPSGTTLTFINRPGGVNFSGNNICNALIDDDGGFPSIGTVAVAPVSGNFSPTSPLSIFDGQDPNGTWTLNVSDMVLSDFGSVRRFSLVITGSAPCPAVPTVTTSGTLNAFTACAGTASAEQSFTVSGSNLTNNLTVTAPAGFEVSATSGSGFASSIPPLVPSGGTVNATTIYVRMAATASGTPSGNIACASTGATTANVAVSGTVTALPVITAPSVTQPTCETPTGTIVVNATGDGTLEYSINDGSSWSGNATFGSLAPASYNIRVRSQSNPSCFTIYSGNPVVLSAATGCCVAPDISAPTVTQPTCGTPTGTIVVNASGGGTLEYSVDDGASWSSNATFANLAPGSYDIQARLQSSPTCLSVYSNNPVVLSPATGCCVAPDISAPTVTQPSCAITTGTIVVNATGGGTLEYSVNNGSSWSTNATFSGLAPGNYNIQVRLQANPACLTIYSGNPVTLSPATGCCVAPDISAPTVTQPTCALPTGTIVVNATGGGTLEYSVNNGSTWSTNATFSGLAPNSYNIRVRIQGNPSCESIYTGNPVVLNAPTGCSGCVITCPANKTVNNAAGQCGRNVNYPAATKTGNCGPLTYSHPSGSFFPVGTTTVTVSSASTGASCTFTVTVNDNQLPVVTVPANITQNAAANACGKVVNFNVSATDNCPGVTVSASPASGSYFPVGVTTVSVVATDASGNMKFSAFNITIKETTKPVITCPGNLTVNADPGVCKALVDPGTATATDNCTGDITITGTRSDGKPLNAYYPLGLTTITWKATDESGNSSTCKQKITVVDNQAPVITGASATPNVLWPANHTMKVVDVNYTTADNCLAQCPVTCVLTVTSNEPITGQGPGDLSPDWQIVNAHRVKLRAERNPNGAGRVYTVKITCTDVAGNSSIETRTVTVPITAPGPATAGPKPVDEETTLSARLLPNPSSNEFSLVLTGGTSEAYEVRVLDISGRELQRIRSADNRIVKFGANLIQGTYLVEVRQGSERIVLKAIKQ